MADSASRGREGSRSDSSCPPEATKKGDSRRSRPEYYFRELSYKIMADPDARRWVALKIYRDSGRGRPLDYIINIQ
ncbi:MAG: hypothetical protein K2H64_07580, partial [Desulfovibrio sp.]|nr:hypothetical protein [Desulfovibrio sp.]